MQVANPLVAGFALSNRSTALVTSNDAFHDVADTHPFHLPHIFNQCDPDPSRPCDLNTTTVTMPVLKAGALFPANNTLRYSQLLGAKFTASPLNSGGGGGGSVGFRGSVNLWVYVSVCLRVCVSCVC